MQCSRNELNFVTDTVILINKTPFRQQVLFLKYGFKAQKMTEIRTHVMCTGTIDNYTKTPQNNYQ